MTTIGIGQLAKRSGVPIDTVRHYERIGLLKPAVRLASGYRRYGESEQKRLRFIRRGKARADFIVANDVGPSGTSSGGVMGGELNRVKIVSKAGVEEWPEMGKDEVAARLADLIAKRLKTLAV